MAAGDLDPLLALLPEPSQPVDAPRSADWAAFESRLGLRLPDDYKRYLERYGSGVVDRFLWVLNPFSTNPNIRFPDASEQQLSILRWIREQGTEALPYPVYPEPGGVLLWAESANGDCFYWITSNGSPDEWPVTVNEARAPKWRDHPGPMTALLGDLLDGTVRIDFFPSNFPTPEHGFAAF